VGNRTEKVLAVGVAESKRTPGYMVLYQRIQGKVGPILRGDFVRVYHVPGDSRSIAFGPVEFWERYRQVQEYSHVRPVVQEIARGSMVPRYRVVLGEAVVESVGLVRGTRR
jgi:hypothetical protein